MPGKPEHVSQVLRRLLEDWRESSRKTRVAVKASRRLQEMRESYPVCRDGIEEKTQQARDLTPSCGIGKVAMHFALGFAAVAAVSFGPEWLVVPVVVAYVATVG